MRAAAVAGLFTLITCSVIASQGAAREPREVRARFEVLLDQKLGPVNFEHDFIRVVRDTADGRCFMVWTATNQNNEKVSTSIGPSVPCESPDR
jgi:hypothetical protein